MSKDTNMGRASHLSQEAALQQNLPSVEAEVGDQPTRPTVHGRHISQNSKKEPPIKPSGTGKPRRIL